MIAPTGQCSNVFLMGNGGVHRAWQVASQSRALS